MAPHNTTRNVSICEDCDTIVTLLILPIDVILPDNSLFIMYALIER